MKFIAVVSNIFVIGSLSFFILPDMMSNVTTEAIEYVILTAALFAAVSNFLVLVSSRIRGDESLLALWIDSKKAKLRSEIERTSAVE